MFICAVGKVSLPAVFNEPLSLLQRSAEDLAYCNLIDAAVGCSEPLERLAYIAAFAVSAYASTHERTLKAFDPLLGETYECCRADLGFRFLAEKVGRSPSTIAFHAESFDSASFDADGGTSRNPPQLTSGFHSRAMLGDSDVVGARYSFWGDMEAKVSFTGRSAELKPSGKLHLQLPQTKDHFTWQKVKSSVHNVIVGDLWIEHSGTMEVRNESTGDSCRLQFGQRDWDAYADRGAASAGNEIKGDVVDSNGAAFAAITGHWHERLEMVPVDVRTPSPAKPARTFVAVAHGGRRRLARRVPRAARCGRWLRRTRTRQ